MSREKVTIYDGNGQKLKIPKVKYEISQLGARCVAQVHRTLRSDSMRASVSLRDATRFFKIWGYLRWEYNRRQKAEQRPREQNNYGSPKYMNGRDQRNQAWQSHYNSYSGGPVSKKEITDMNIRLDTVYGLLKQLKASIWLVIGKEKRKLGMFKVALALLLQLLLLIVWKDRRKAPVLFFSFPGKCF